MGLGAREPGMQLPSQNYELLHNEYKMVSGNGEENKTRGSGERLQHMIRKEASSQKDIPRDNAQVKVRGTELK